MYDIQKLESISESFRVGGSMLIIILKRLLNFLFCVDFSATKIVLTVLCHMIITHKNYDLFVQWMLFDSCNDLYNTREYMWHNVLQSAPIGMREEFRLMSGMDKGRLHVWLYICYWSDIYFSILDFTFAIEYVKGDKGMIESNVS